jgi:hypothetical protein
VCSECGLEFRWLDVLESWRQRVPGFIEHERSSLRPLIMAVWRTLMLALLPWRFWSKVRLETPPVPGRAVLWLLLGVLVPIVAAIAWASTLVLIVLPEQLRGNVLLDAAMLGSGWNWRHHLWRQVAAFVIASLCWPCVMMLLPHTRKRSKVRAGHVLRAALYANAWLLLVIALRALWYVTLCGLSFFMMLTSSSPGALTKGGLYPVHQFIVELWWPLSSHTRWVVAAFMIWMMTWWYFAISRGFRIKEAKTVWVALVIPAWLALAASWMYLIG